MARRAVRVAIGLAMVSFAGQWAEGQVIERERTITGPAGRSVTRGVRVERGPGGVTRQLRVEGPNGGTYEREVEISRRPGYGPGPGRGHGYGYGPPRGGFGGPVVGLAGAFGIATPGFGLFVGSAPPPPPVFYAPPPVVVVPEPIYVEPPPPPAVIYHPPQRLAPPVEVHVDPVADALDRLRSGHGNSRREGALVLGRLGDPRAIPGLLDRLKYDNDRDVRAAAAWALGEIGDPSVGVYLERASVYDKKGEVRDAAARARARLDQTVAAAQAAAAELPPEGEVIIEEEPVRPSAAVRSARPTRRTVPKPPVPAIEDDLTIPLPPPAPGSAG